MRPALVLAVIVLAGVLPAVASAHVGKTLPVATDFTARVTGSLPGIAARPLDGDQTLWLRAPASAVVVVLGILREPLLRFDSRGVWLNLRSPTAQSDQIDRFDLRPTATGRPPLWHRVARTRSYLWHEHRLHALEPVARSAGSAGPWSVPVVVDGRAQSLRGTLEYTAPGAAWAWMAVAGVLAAAAAWAALRSTAALVAFALLGTAGVWAIRLGRELYGRPSVATLGWIEIGATSAIGAVLFFGLTRRSAGTRISTAFFVGFGALYEALVMFPVLTHSIALNALPSTAARTLEVAVVITAAGTLSGSIFGTMRGEPA